jgi:chemotaxis protein histidine kinase CheA
VGLLSYVKAAFTNRWNLLALGGALGFAFLSGRPDVFAPLILAGEIAYLGLLGTHPKFQRYVEAQAAKRAREQGAVDVEQVLRRILSALPKPSLRRFEALRARCLELQQIALELKDPSQVRPSTDLSPPSTKNPLDELHLAGLDRLLWMYVRLLFTQSALERFLQQTDEEQIQEDIQRLEAQLRDEKNAPDSPQQQKICKAIEDNLSTCRERLANLRKAWDTYELVQLEADRLENKIHSLGELAINRHEPDFLSAQIDQAVSSMKHTERTMQELRFATGIDISEDVAPELLRREVLQVK